MFSYTKLLLFSFFLVFSFLSCDTNEREKKLLATAQIMELHELQRKYHFEKMVTEFVNLLSDDHISVNRGEIKKPTKNEHKARFQAYFDTVTFEKWDDLDPPVIRFSEDYTLAYTVVHKEVVVVYKNEENNQVRETNDFSWLAIYKKYPEGWKIDCVASTNKPEIVNVIEEG